MSDHMMLADVIADGGAGPWWFACEHPERPHDGWTVWDESCRPCRIHLDVAAAAEPHRQGRRFSSAGAHGEWLPLAVVARTGAAATEPVE